MSKNLQLPWLFGQNIAPYKYYYLVKKDQINRAEVDPPFPQTGNARFFCLDVFPKFCGITYCKTKTVKTHQNSQVKIGQSKDLFDIACLAWVAVSVTDGVIFFWWSHWGSLASFTPSENFISPEVMFDRGKFPPLLLPLLSPKKSFSKVVLSKGSSS